MPAGVYIHIPFCKSRCSYCDFATDVYRDAGRVERYVAALAAEIRGFSREAPITADTIYFGGGTPSLLEPSQLSAILDAVRSRFNIADDAEITLEMNPGTVTADKLAAYRALGVNRASFGVQSFDERQLKLLARGHDADDARTAFRLLREAEFDNISLDLIAGLPEQTMDIWLNDLAEAIGLGPEHISLYLLEVHEATPLAEQLRSGRRPMPDDELAAEMYEEMLARLELAGYGQYEISNFSRPGLSSRHNTKYWRLDPVYGFGVSAHSFDGAYRWSNLRDTDAYVAAVEDAASAVADLQPLSVKQLSGEYAFLNLRLTRGIRFSEYSDRFGVDLREAFGEDLDRLAGDGLIELDADSVKLTARGKLFSNEVFAVFV